VEFYARKLVSDVTATQTAGSFSPELLLYDDGVL
jgi:hypothetical protein